MSQFLLDAPPALSLRCVHRRCAISPGERNDLKLLRTVLARELDTISEYEGYAAEAEDERLQAFFQHLADEEKEHVAEALALIEERDLVQQSQRTGVDIRPEHFAGEQKESAAGAIKPAADQPEEATGEEPPAPAKVLITTGPMTGRGQFTVGSLKKRR